MSGKKEPKRNGMAALQALQNLKEEAACPKRLSTKILLQRKKRKGVRNVVM